MKEPTHYALLLDDLFDFIKNKVKTIFLIVIRFPYIIDYVKQVDEFSSYPENMRKSKTCIVLDNLLWIIKNGEVNRNYFQYLFDRKHEPVDQSKYMPFHLYNRLRKKVNRGVKLFDGYLSYICILRDKYVFCKFLKGLSLPTPDVVAIYEKGKIKWTESGNIDDVENIFQYEDVDFFCKGINGESGNSVLHLAIENEQFLINGKKASIQDLKKRVTSKSIFQKRIIQHKKMDQLYSGSVNTIRIGTFNNGNNVIVFNAILKLGAPGEVLDNWHFGGIVVGIDLHTGNLRPYGIPPKKCANKLMKHPSSDIAFEGFKIPFFQDALELVKKLHGELYGIVTIGWDIAISEKGPLVLEGNDNWDFRMFQAYYGGCKERLLELFNE